MKTKPLAIGLIVGLLTSGSALAQRAEAFTDGGTVTTNHFHTGAQLLQSFYFHFKNNDDHNIQLIGLTPDTPSLGRMTVSFADENGDDDYNYIIQHYDAPSSGITTSVFGSEFCVRSCTLPIPRPAGDNVFVLRGFKVFFHGTDHHLDQLRIHEDNGNLTVAFNDKNDDDTFIYDVYYAYVPRSRFTNIGASSGHVQTNGGQSTFVPAGTAVIRGFNFDLTGNVDHEINDIGIIFRGNGRFDIFHGDQAKDDPFDWNLEWGIMN